VRYSQDNRGGDTMQTAQKLIRAGLQKGLLSFDDKSVVLLSGGVDSSAIVAYLIEIGVKPDCLTFGLSGRDSHDIIAAKKITTYYGLKHHIIKIDRSKLESLVRQTIGIIKTSRKTHVQCALPLIPTCELMLTLGYNSAYVGYAIGDVLPCGRKSSVAYSSGGDKSWKEWRKNKFDTSNKDKKSSYISMDAIFKHFNVSMVDPYRNNCIRELVNFSYNELMKPKQKIILCKSFPAFFLNGGGFYRKQASYQVVSGMREWHDTLLSTELNTRGLKAVVGIYNDILKGVV